MQQNHTNYSSAVNLESPIAIMPFGKYKGELIWTLHLNTVAWMKENMKLTERSVRTLNDAMDMGLKAGEFAVMRKFKAERWHTQLQGIYSTQVLAETHCNHGEGFDDFVYHIVKEAVTV